MEFDESMLMAFSYSTRAYFNLPNIKNAFPYLC